MSKNLEYGRVYTTRIQKPHFSGLGVFDPNKVFFKEDPNGKVYIDDKLCSIVKTPGESNLVMISGKFYKFVQIGDQIWLAENLDMPFTGATYYDDDPSQSYGLMYIGNKIEELQEALADSGWHIPTDAEFEELAQYAGGNPNCGIYLKSTESWNTNNGQNLLGFDGKAGGIHIGTRYAYLGEYGVFWSCVPIPSNSQQKRLVLQDVNQSYYINGLNNKYRVNVRLIKDTEPLLLDGKIYRTAKIGDRIWTIENLNYKIPGIAYNPTGAGTTDPSCWKWNNGDTEVRPKGGMYYNAFAAKYINDNNIIPGWHAAYAGELDELNTYANSENAKLRNLSEWPTETVSTNDYRFNAIPAGNRANTGSWANQTDYALITSCTIDGDNTYRLNINTNSTSTTFGTSNNRIGYSIRLVKDTEPVEIGGKKYKTQKIGNQLWMTENLDYIFEGLNVGGATLQDDVHAWYFNNDPEQSEGLLYNGYAAKYLAEHPELLPEGWRVPETSDFGALQVAVGGANTAGTMLKNPGNMNGINYYGFNGLATGMIRSTGAFTDRNTYLRLWTSNISQADETAQQFLTLESDKNTSTIVSFANDQVVAYSIRLVKDLTPGSLAKGGSGNDNVGKEIDEKEIDKVDEEIKDDSKEETLKK